jgi:hypothetical protein
MRLEKMKKSRRLRLFSSRRQKRSQVSLRRFMQLLLSSIILRSG